MEQKTLSAEMMMKAKAILVGAINQTGLPPYLLDGLISQILCMIREQELAELSASMLKAQENDEAAE